MVLNLAQNNQQVKASLQMNREHVLAAANRNFQSIRAKISKVINDAVAAAVDSDVTLENKKSIVSGIIHFLTFFYAGVVFFWSVYDYE